MCPIYAVLAAPLARPLGVPLLLWFTHWKRDADARSRGEGVAPPSSASTSARSRSTRPRSLRSATASTSTSSRAAPRVGARTTLRVASLGRYSRAKGLETVVRAIALLDGVRLEAFGPALSAAEREHKAELARLVGELGLDSRVRLDAAVLRSEVPELLAPRRLPRQQHGGRRARQGRLRGRRRAACP